MTPDGINQIDPAERKNCTIIYLDIDLETRRNRLYYRGDVSDTIERRIKADEIDFKNFTDFDLIINNKNF
jgi:guanylate kinase